MKRLGMLCMLASFALGEIAAPMAFAADAPPIKVGMSAGITGYLADLDQAVRDGAQLAVERINREGGVLGRRIELVVEDMRGEPQQAVTAITKLIVSDKVAILVNGFSSAGNAAGAPVAARHKVPMVIASILPPAEQVESVKWTVSTLPPAAFEVGTRLEYLQKQGRAKKVGVLHDPTPYANLQKNLAQGQAQKLGLALAGIEQYKVDDTDLKPQLTKLRAAGAEAIVKAGVGPTSIVAAKNMRELGMNMPLLTSMDDLAIVKPAAEALGDRFFFVASAPQVPDALELNDPVRRALGPFVQAWTARYGQRDPAYAGRGWDAVHLVAEAIKRAGGTDGEKLREALENTPTFVATSAVYSYSPKTHVGVQTNPYKLGIMQGGKVNLVYDPAK